MCVYSGHQFDVSSKCFWNHKLPHWNWNRQSLFQKSLHRQNQQLHATALQPLHIHPFPCCHLGPRIGGGPANTVFQNVYVSIVYTFFFTHTSQISFPQMLFLVLPVRQILKHPSFTLFELLIWQLSVDDVCGDIGSKLLFQFRPQKPSPDSCCFGPMFVYKWRCRDVNVSNHHRKRAKLHTGMCSWMFLSDRWTGFMIISKRLNCSIQTIYRSSFGINQESSSSLCSNPFDFLRCIWTLARFCFFLK